MRAIALSAALLACAGFSAPSAAQTWDNTVSRHDGFSVVIPLRVAFEQQAWCTAAAETNNALYAVLSKADHLFDERHEASKATGAYTYPRLEARARAMGLSDAEYQRRGQAANAELNRRVPDLQRLGPESTVGQGTAVWLALDAQLTKGDCPVEIVFH